MAPIASTEHAYYYYRMAYQKNWSDFTRFQYLTLLYKRAIMHTSDAMSERKTKKEKTMKRSIFAIVAAVIVLLNVHNVKAEGINVKLHSYNATTVVMQINTTDYVCADVRVNDEEIWDGAAILIDDHTFSIDKDGTTYTWEYSPIKCDNAMINILHIDLPENMTRGMLTNVVAVSNGWYHAELNGQTITMKNADKLIATGGEVLYNDNVIAIYNTATYDYWYYETYTSAPVYTVNLPIVMN